MTAHEHEPTDVNRARPTPEPREAEPRARAVRPPLSPTHLLALQSSIGNQGVRGLIAAQRSAGDAPAPAGGSAAITDVVGRGAGDPLPGPTRTQMETALGQDFADVRVHTGPAADASARAISANAYTVGSEIVFADGRFDPSSERGRETLAHELTHVVQQRSGPVDGTPMAEGVAVSDPGDRFEQEATSVGARVARGEPAGPLGAAVQREASDEVDDLAVQRETATQLEEEPGTE